MIKILFYKPGPTLDKVKNLSNKGIDIGDVKLNLEKMMKAKDKSVTVLTKGVEFLLKKNKVTYYKGLASFKSKNEILIKDNQNKENIIEQLSIKRIGKPEDISNIVSFLCNEESEYITGQVIPVDGGLTT